MSDPRTGIRYVAGIDGGGTKTNLVLYEAAADGTLRPAASCRAGGMNYNHIGVPRAVASVTDGLMTLCASCGLSPDKLSAVGIGDPSCDIETAGPTGDAFRAALSDAVRVPILLRSDAYVSLFSLTGGLCPGVLTISGTGAICIGEDAERRLYVAGGWGQLTGDEGSGYYIGLSGIKAALRAADGIAPMTALLPAVLDFFGVSDPRDLIGVLYDPEKSVSPADFARTVDICAQNGDAAAEDILSRAAEYLAAYTASVVRRSGATLVGVHGSVLIGNATVRAGFEARLRVLCPGVRIREPATSPEEAAARLAMRELLRLPCSFGTACITNSD
ncbi:MAG: hypothetical protein MJ192_00875 [Clostridia bacterium]|nr:hypothetical protein [Clostridia bacterium]